MNGQETTCCICKNTFTDASQPRMMPYCEHSACTSCLKKIISKNKEPTIICQHCGHQENLTEVDLQYFPKNICLTKMLKQKSNLLSSHQSQSSRDSITSNNAAQLDRQICQQHKKDMQLICINDRIKLCPHCALFGSHKDHKFKTITEVDQHIQSTYAQFIGFKEKKVQIDYKINSNQFKDGIVKKIGQQKDRLVCEIKKKFGQMIQNVKLAEKKAYEDVVKNFKTVYTKILTLIKEQNESQERYKKWQSKCTELFLKSEKLKRVEDKVALYYGGPLEICSEGSSILKKLQTKINSNIQVIETLISQIKVVQNNGIVNSVFNYINVVLEDSEIDLLGNIHQEVISPREYKEEVKKEQKIEFGGDHLHTQRDSISPIRKKSKSKDIATKVPNSEKRSSNKIAGSSERGTVNELVEQFCQRENLDTLDLTNYSLNDQEIYEVMAYLRPIKRIKGLKLVKNKLTNDGLSRIIELMPFVTNINLSFNQLGDECIITLLNNRPKISSLRIINLSNNKINERKTKNSIQQLKKQGVIVTL